MLISYLVFEMSKDDEDGVVDDRHSESLEVERVLLAKQSISVSVTEMVDRRVADRLVLRRDVFRPFQHLDAAVELVAMVLGVCC